MDFQQLVALDRWDEYQSRDP